MPQQNKQNNLQSSQKTKQVFKPIWIIISVIAAILIIGGIYTWQKNVKNSETVIKIPQPDNWNYNYISPDDQVANYVLKFLLSMDNEATEWLKEQLIIDNAEAEKIQDYFNHRDYFRDKSKLRKEIILSLCTEPDKAYSLITENFNRQVSYNHPTYPISEFTQCLIRTTQHRQEAINFLQDILINSNPEEYRIKIAAAEALSDIKNQDSLPIIEQSLEKQTNKYAIAYFQKSIKRIKGGKDLPFLENELLGGVKLNFSLDDIENIQLVEGHNNNLMLQFSEKDFPIILEYIKKGKIEKSTDKLIISETKTLCINLKNKMKVEIVYDDWVEDLSSNKEYFSYHYYDRFFDPQEKKWVVFENRELSNLIKQRVNEYKNF